MTTVLAIDIGGTKMAAAIVEVTDSQTPQFVARSIVPTPSGPSADRETLWQTLVGLVDDLGELSDVSLVGVGVGGPMNEDGSLVSPLNIPGWRDFDLKGRLSELTDLGGVHVENDGKALALAEGWVGAASGQKNFMAMVVSTGVGGGIVLDGRLLHGASGNAGHIGHVIVEPLGHTMAGHAQGSLEGEASGLAIQQQTGRAPAEAGEATVRLIGSLVGRGVASVCNLLDLPLVVVAGSVALGFGEPFFASAQAELDRLCLLDFSRGSRIVPAGLGSDGPLTGAVAVALRASGHDIGIS